MSPGACLVGHGLIKNEFGYLSCPKSDTHRVYLVLFHQPSPHSMALVSIQYGCAG
jgi:hypothetical protein